MEESKKNPFGILLGCGLGAALLCFGLAAFRPSADAYLLGGIAGLLVVAAAWTLRSAWDPSRLRWEQLQHALQRLEEKLPTLKPETASDPDRAANTMRQALEEGLRTGFAPVVPALRQQMEASFGSLADTLRSDREERAGVLRETNETLSGLQKLQREGAQAAANLLEKIDQNAAAWQREMAARDQGLRVTLEEARSASASDRKSQFDILQQGLQAARAAADAVRDDAGARLLAASQQAEAWLQGLSVASGKLQEAFQGAQRFGEASDLHQTELKAAVDMLTQGLTGVLDWLQSFAALAEGQEALLGKMETVLHHFEARSVELLEENALRSQEALLDILARTEPVAPVSEPDLIRAEETEPHAH